MIDDELGARLEVRAVELVGDVPAEGPELPPLLHDGVEEGHGVEEGGPGLVAGVVQVVLGDVRVKSLQTRPDTLGWLVGVLTWRRNEELTLELISFNTFIDI